MSITFDIKETSTKRGLVWCIFAMVASVGWWLGKDINGLVIIASAVAGGLGVAVKDK